MLSRPLALVVFLFLSFSLLVQPVNAASTTQLELTYCKCICFQNSTIIPLYLPNDRKHPCASCTKAFCLDQKLPICKDASLGHINLDITSGTEGDVEARCFKRGSPRDQAILTIFIIIIFGLVLVAFARPRMERLGWSFGRGFSSWKDVIPSRSAIQPETRQQYAPVSVGS